MSDETKLEPNVTITFNARELLTLVEFFRIGIVTGQAVVKGGFIPVVQELIHSVTNKLDKAVDNAQAQAKDLKETTPPWAGTITKTPENKN